jgi:hypothetical protein
MAVDSYELEGMAEEAYARAGGSPSDVWRPSTIARRLGIQLMREPNSMARGRITLDGDCPRITVRAGLPRPIEEWTIGHEIGHFLGLRQDQEREADYFGAALQMRRRPFLRALYQRGNAWHELGPIFGATSTSAALRAAELEERAMAIVTPARVYPHLIQLPEHEIRRLARVGGPGLARTQLEDDRRRIVLEAMGFTDE